METLSSTDALFLAIDSSQTHMHVGGFSIFDPSTRPSGRLTYEEWRDRVVSRLPRLPRLHQRLDQDPFHLGHPRWVFDAAFDPEQHLIHEALPAPGGLHELEELAGWVMSQPMERDRPLWENHFVEGLAGGRVAVIVKAHHAMEDGLASLRQTELVFDDDRSAAGRSKRRPAPVQAQPSKGVQALVDRILDAPIPGATGHRVGTALAGAAGLADFLGEGLLAPATPLNGSVGQERAVATWTAPLDLVREVHHRLGVSFNDVILAVTAAGLRRYFLRRGVPPPPRVRVLIPVSTRGDGMKAFGNEVSAFLVDLDLGQASAAARAEQASAACHAGRARDEATALALVAEMSGILAAPLQRAAERLVLGNRLFNLVVSNVRGLERPLSLLGARHLVSYPLMPLGPQSGLSIAVLTMGGVLGYGITCDPRLVPEPEELASGVADAFRELLDQTGVEPRPTVRRSSRPPAAAAARRR